MSTVHLDLVRKLQSGSHAVIGKLVDFAGESDRNKQTLLKTPGFLDACVAEIVKPGVSVNTRVRLYGLLADIAHRNSENRLALYKARGVVDAALKGIECEDYAVRGEALNLLAELACNDESRYALSRLDFVIKAAVKSISHSAAELPLSPTIQQQPQQQQSPAFATNDADDAVRVGNLPERRSSSNLFRVSSLLTSWKSRSTAKQGSDGDEGSSNDQNQNLALSSSTSPKHLQPQLAAPGKRPSNLSMAGSLANSTSAGSGTGTNAGGNGRGTLSSDRSAVDSIANGLNSLGRATRVTQVGQKVLALATGEARLINRCKQMAFKLLEQLTSSHIEDPRRTVMNASGVMPATLQAVRSIESGVQRHAFGLLANLASTKEAKALLVGMPDLVQDTLVVIKEGDRAVCRNALVFLANLSALEDNAPGLFRTPDLVQCVLAVASNRSPESADLREEAFRVLLNLAARDASIKVEMVAIPQMVDTALVAIRIGDDSELKEFALNFLGNLACDSPANQVGLGTYPGLVDTLLTVARDTEKPEIRNEAFEVLQQLAGADEMRVVLAGMGRVLDTLIACVIQREREAYESKRLALEVISLVAEHPATKVGMFHHPDLVKETLRAAKSGETKEIKECAFKVVYALCLSLELREKMLAWPGVADLLRAGVRSRQESTRVLSSLALGCIGGTDEDICDMLREAECFDVILKVLGASLAGERVFGMTFKLWEVLVTVRSLSGTRENRVWFGPALVVMLETGVSKATQAEVDDPVSAEYALFALSQFALDTDSDVWMRHKKTVAALAAGLPERVCKSKRDWDPARKIASGLLMSEVSEMM